jgi:hypothetical protein
MAHALLFTTEAKTQLEAIAASDVRKLKKIRKTLGLLESNLRHPSLRTHVYGSLQGLQGEKVFEAYVENNTPGAHRVFWHYGPGKDVLTVIAITGHP